MSKQIKKQIEVSHNPATGYVFIKDITGEVTAAELEQAKRDYYAKAKKAASVRAAAMASFDAQFLNSK